MAFHELKITDVRAETDHAVSLAFDVPPELRDDFKFLPGQYLTLRSDIDGEDVRRSYSICSVEGEALRVGIKQVEEGRFSNFARELKPGDALNVMPPEGRFTIDPVSGKPKDLILIAAGSGITPMLSIARSVLESDKNNSVTLVYGNQMTSSIMFRTELEDLKDRFLQRFHIYHVLSQEAQDVDLFHGRIDVDRVAKFIEKGIVRLQEADEVFLCGPAEMSISIADMLKANGISESRIHTELFETPDQVKPKRVSQQVSSAAEVGANIEVILDGSRRIFPYADTEDTVLTAASKSGLELPFSCAGGMCATCRCKIVEGEGEMEKNYSLADWELEAGFVLGCQTRPKTEKLVLDFDAT